MSTPDQEDHNSIHSIHEAIPSEPNDEQLERQLTNASVVSIQASPNFNEISLPHEILFIGLICMSQLLTQAAVSQTMNTSEQVADTFGVESNPGEISWFSASFSLTVGTFILISGRLGDMYGYKRMYIVGYAWFCIFSLITGFAAFAKSSIFFDVMRACQGMGPAIMMPNSQAIIGSYYPPGGRKNICMAAFGAVAPTGFIFGAIFSGIFSQLVWWPWTFWVCGMVSALVATIAFFVIPAKIGIRSAGSFDYLGSFFGVTGLVLINFSWNQGPVVGWHVPYVYVLLIIGFISMGIFVYVEKKVKDPLVPPEVLSGETGFVLACIAAGWSCFGVWLFYTFRWSLLIDGDGPILSATKNIPSLFTGYVAAFMTAYLVRKIPSSLILFLAMLSFLVGIVLMGTRPVGQNYWAQKFVSLIITPFGMDMSFPAGCIILSTTLPKSQQGIAGSLVSTFVNYSISIGLGFAGTVQYYMTKDMDPNSIETTIYGMRMAFRMGMGLAGLGVLVSALFMVLQYRYNKKQALLAQEQITEKTTPDSAESKESDEDEVENVQ
ncbi:major facilitator superfamily domain-containing protein [Scheffersomyces coipomensis]|uniref:major facilitator superfamily domain-containing protein n=1 Tax=Scheffersomyces coipomensis TaxID=1788519 RepID=UPI00315D1F80